MRASRGARLVVVGMISIDLPLLMTMIWGYVPSLMVGFIVSHMAQSFKRIYAQKSDQESLKEPVDTDAEMQLEKA